MMNSDEISSENVLVTSDDLDGFLQNQNSSDTTKDLKVVLESQTEIKNTTTTNEPNPVADLDENDIFDPQDFYDVIVVGAGLSGLSSAYFLKKKHPNLRMLIIEAKDRVGGRTQTIEMKCTEDGHKEKWDVGGKLVCLEF